MRRLIALASLITLTAAAPALKVDQLGAGRYALRISGLWCTTCVRAVEAELKALPEVESAKGDFDSESVVITVKLEKTLKVSAIRRAIKRANGRADFGNKLGLASVAYLVTD